MSFTHRLSTDDIRKTDVHDMMGHVARMGGHVRESISLTQKALSTWTLPSSIQHIVLAGMGGSAIGGDFVRAYAAKDLNIPFVVSRSYDLPQFASERTLVIASSYSGNTEETLSQFDEAARRGCNLVCLTTGGALAERARKHNALILPLAPGLMPRAAFAYSFVPVLLLLERLGFTRDEQEHLSTAATLLDTLAERYGAKNLSETNPAFALAAQLQHRLPVIYSSGDFEPVNLRWRGQMVENAKHLAFGHVLPELNHNEIEGWSHPADILQHFFVVILRSPQDENPRIQLRFSALKEILSGKQVPIVEVAAEGATRIERMLSLISMADWTSLYLAFFAGTDPTPIPVMEALKKRLASV